MNYKGLKVRIVCDGRFSKVWLNDQQLENCVVAAEFRHNVDGPAFTGRPGGTLKLTLEVEEFVFDGPVSVNHVLVDAATLREVTPE